MMTERPWTQDDITRLIDRCHALEADNELLREELREALDVLIGRGVILRIQDDDEYRARLAELGGEPWQ